MTTRLVLLATSALSISCGSIPVEERPVPLDQALISVSKAFDALEKDIKANNRQRVGLMPEEVSVVLALSKQTTESGTLSVNLAAPSIPVTTGGSYTKGRDHSIANTITVTYRSPYFAEDGTPISKLDPAAIKEFFFKQENGGGVKLMEKKPEALPNGTLNPK